MFNRLSTREKILLFTAIFLLILGLYYFYVYSPYQKEIDNLKSQKKNKSQQIINMKSKIRDLPVIEKEYNYRLNKIKNRIFISGFSSEGLLNNLVKIASETRVNILNYYPKKQENTIRITTILRGDYLSLIDFLSSLEEWDKQLQFERLNFHPVEGQIELELHFVYHNWEEIGGINL